MKKLYLLLVTLFVLAQSSFSQITVGEQTSTVALLPVYQYYGYTYSQSIYPAASIGTSGDITGITYYCVNGIDISVTNQWGVYIGHTSQSMFSNSSSWVSIADLDTVHYGLVSVVGDSIHIEFDTPFTYNGTDNIVIAVEDNAPGYNGYGSWFYGSSSDSASIVHYNDFTDQDPSSPPTTAVTISSSFPTVTFHGIVQTCQEPQNLSVDSILTDSSVFAQWDGDPSSTYVVVVESSNTMSSDTLNATQLFIDTLSSFTDYTIKVKEICGAGDTSIFNTVNFTTLCSNEIPDYLETFDDFLPDCWEERKGVISDSTVFSSSFFIGWNSSTFANVPGQSPSTKINLYSNVYDWLLSPSIDLGDGSTQYMLEFDIALTSWNGTGANTFGSDDQFAVVISLDDGLTWSSNNIIESWSDGMTFSNTGETLIYDLSAYSGVVKIGFYGYSPTINNDIDLHLDNISVREIPPCLEPTALDAISITDTSAVLIWEGGANDSIYFLAFGTPGFDLDSATLVQLSSDSVQIDSLIPNTAYEFYVSTLCSGSDSSGWAGPYGFQTVCSAVVPPTDVEIFTTYVPECWSQAGGLLFDTTQVNTGSSNWTADGFGNNGTSGSARINIYGPNVKDWLITKTYDLGTPLTNYQAEFRLGLTSFFTSNPSYFGIDDRFIFLYSTDGGATWLSSNILQEWNASHALGVDEYLVVDLGALTGQVTFAFYAESQTSNSDINIYVDDFVINKCTEYVYLNDTVCDSYISPLGNEYTSTGIYTDTIISQACDTVFVMDLQVNNFSVDSVQIIECDTFVSVTGNLITESGIYYDTIPNVFGCDSIIQTVLSVLYIDLALDLENNIFVLSNETDPSAEYTWINCEDGSVIEGENSSTFVATELGEYACIISMVNCTQTTDCIEITSLDTTSTDTTIAIDEYNSSLFDLYPNPTNGEFKVEIDNYEGATLLIFNAVGQVVHYQKIEDRVTSINLNSVQRGLYFISINSENRTYRKRLVID